ncbi:MAG TPA: helix-turn-helix domain-containing GNAT family N-acetyltransferase [Ramlibacter sp.]|nr:helix-turn-helix domain-containing GNAT family N-acetyltransferase [Ramlibacter sp.]
MKRISSSVPAAHVEAVRGFNRFYTQRAGVLDPYLDGELSLTEVRVLHELAHRDQPTASELARDLDLDAGYLSRILRRFGNRGWLRRTVSAADARQAHLRLTAAGRRAFEPLQRQSRKEATDLLSPLTTAQRTALVDAMGTVRGLLDPGHAPAAGGTVVLRDPRPGDLGWVVQQHGEIYWREYRFSSNFEGLVARVAGQYLERFDPAWEKGWIAEVDGERAGSVFVMRRSKTVAQLRLLLLTPSARGRGLGGRLTDECIAFARSKGYRKLTLWTQSILLAARAIYRARGFQIVKSEPYPAFGQKLVSEVWELTL